MTPLRAVAIQHDALVGPGLLTPALTRAGFSVEQRFQECAGEDLDADLLVVLGGFMSARELDRNPFLRQEQTLLERRLGLGRPVLGLCLGAQLLALAAGGRVYPSGSGLVVGVHPIVSTPEGRRDPLFRGMGDRLEVVHWYQDAFDLPPRAIRLASSKTCPNEAFRIGNAWGLQFHPETDAASFEQWIRHAPDAVMSTGRNPDDVLRYDLWRLRAVEHRNAAMLDRLVAWIARTTVEPEPPAGPIPA